MARLKLKVRKKVKGAVVQSEVADVPIITVPLHKLQKAPWNFKEDGRSSEAYERFMQSIRKNGATVLSVALREEDGEYEVLDGNHRLDAYTDLKLRTVRCFDYGTLPEARRKALGLIFNSKWFDEDYAKIAALAKEAMEAPIDFEGMSPFDEEELSRLVASANLDLSALDDNDLDDDGEDEYIKHEEDGGDDDDSDNPPLQDDGALDDDEDDLSGHPVTCPKCKHKFSL